MNTAEVIATARKHLEGLRGYTLEVIDVARPVSPEAASNLAKIVSKLSPLVGNLIEFNTCEYLNTKPEFRELGRWKRQDPGFPDTVFDGPVRPTPGFEIKAWFPLATEITARFKDSQNHFTEDQTYVAMLAWTPEFLIYGKPKIVDIVTVSAASVAKARDTHYHDPPDYLVLEPEDTRRRTQNLQQTNTNGYKFQGSADELAEAKAIVRGWGRKRTEYRPTPAYQRLLRELLGKYTYRLDTNFAKMDRIVHREIEEFKTRVHDTNLHGKTLREWTSFLKGASDEDMREALAQLLALSDNANAPVE